MSIVSLFNELQSLKIAIGKNNKDNAILRKRAKTIEQQLTDHVEAKNPAGVKFQDTAILIDKSQKWLHKSKKDAEEDSIKVLEDFGVSNPRLVLDELKKARKGEETESKKIKIKKIKNRN